MKDSTNNLPAIVFGLLGAMPLALAFFDLAPIALLVIINTIPFLVVLGLNYTRTKNSKYGPSNYSIYNFHSLMVCIFVFNMPLVNYCILIDVCDAIQYEEHNFKKLLELTLYLPLLALLGVFLL